MAQNNLLGVVEDEKGNRYYRNYRLSLYEARMAKIQSALYEYFQELKCTDAFIRNFFVDMKMYGRNQFESDELEIIDKHLEDYRKVSEEMEAYEERIRVGK